MNTQKYQDKETGQDRYSTRIIADQMKMLGGRDDDGGQRQAPPQRAQPTQRERPAQQQAPSPNDDDFDSIPF